MELIKHSYELSVWDFPEEVKKAVIGSDTMSSPARVLDPILTRNVNGTVTLTFKLYTQYFDNDKGEFVENPFISLLMTERVLKLKYKGKWYDLVIKNRQESSDQKMYSYTAKSLHINELSKNGFELEFKTELENNQGTIFELGDRIVEGTDWTIDRNGSKLPRAWRDDQLILCKATTSFPQNYTGTVMLTKDDYPINRGEYFYAFYSDWTNFAANGGEIQLLCIPNHKSENLENYILEGEYFDSDGIITIKDAKENIVAQNILAKDLNKDTIEKIGISNYRGRRLVKQQKTKYNSVLDKYVNIYNNGEVEGYTKTKYLSPAFVQNLIVNPKDFTSTAGWYADVTNTSHASVDLDIYPPIDVGANENTLYSSRIRFTASESGQIVYNTAIRSNLTKIDEIKPQDIYILRYKFVDTEDNLISNAPVNFQFTTSKIEGRDIVKTITIKNQTSASVNGFYEREVIFTSALTKKQLQDIRFEIVLNSTDSIYLKEMELFKKVEAIKQIKDDEGNISYTDKNEILYPGDIPKSDPIEEKFFYNVADNINAKEADDYKYLENTDTNSYIAVYNDNEYEKIASIEKSESNRFNLIQDLCESFECWADFIIEHDDDGKIIGRKIQFKEYIGNTKWAGFKYGINLKSVQRTIDSEQIVTKTIVKANSNEHGTNGFCTIERAVDNPTGQSYILNFDYYLSQGLLDRESLTNDLYINFEGNNKGFYDLMQEKSRLRDDIITRRTAESASFLEGIAYLKVAQEAKEAANQELSELLAEYKKYSNVEYPTIAESAQKDGEILDQKVVEYFASIGRVKQVLSTAEQDCIDYADFTQEAYDEIMKGYEQEIEDLQIEEINNSFLNKYKNFIQEGTWTSEEYWDDNLYYLDALDVSRTSSKPKVTYTINVIDVSVFEDYQAYNIDVGDKTFVEDAEFFGYTLYQPSENSSFYKKPYREEIVVTEIQEHLEAPEANQIKVQNYKTQFDDLFQRITAATQSLQYASGGYNRASAAFNSDGTIDGDIVQNTLLSYAFTLMNPENDTVLWDEEGIKIIDRKDVSKIIKLAGGELAITNNGGETWTTAVDANGIHIDLVTSGTINTDKVLIGNSKDYSFRWDSLGLNAYTQEDTETGAYDYGKFVRFDKYGLYGYSQGEYFEPRELDEVKEKADFGLTWDGFFLRSKAREGWIEIDSENDFRVLIGTPDNYLEKIKIGELSDGTFGIIIKDANGNDAFYTDDNGDLTVIGHIEASSGSFKGHIEAGSGDIGGWHIGSDSAGNTVLSSVQSIDGNINSGIILNANTSSMYSASYVDSLGSTGWSIQENNAYFNNITLRGALKCAVLEYAEVSAIGGILMVRPATSIKKSEYINQELKLTVENAAFFKEGDWCKITTNIDEDLNKDGELYTGINNYLFKCIGKNIEEKNNIVYLEIPKEEEHNVLNKNFEGLGLVSLGQTGNGNTDGSIGLGLNSSTNDAMLPPESFSVFSFEESIYSGGSNWKYLKPHIILGKIPNNEDVYGTVAGKYGLYADAAEITGAIHATSISTVDTSGNETKLPIGADGKLSQEAIGGLKDSLSSLQDQVDGVIDTWYLEDEPSVDRPPWGNTAENDKHIGDLYYDKKTGYSYRFWKKEDGTYEWARISDSDITTALNQIAQTNAALDTKVSTFMEQAGVVTPNIVPQSANEGDLLFTQDGKIYILGTDRQWKLQIQEITPDREEYAYAETDSGTDIPKEWSSTRPDPTPGKYLWTKTKIIYSDGSFSESFTVAYQGTDGQNGAPGAPGASGRNLIIFGEQVFKKGENNSYSPNTITLVARYSDDSTTDQQVYWSYKNGNNFTPIHTQTTGSIWNQQTVHISSNKCEIDPVSNNGYFINDIATIRAQVINNNTVEYEDIFSVYRISDGYTPQKGQDYFDGTDGEDGTSIVWQGTFSTPPKNPKNGWAYYNSTAKASYVYQNGAWYQMSIDGIDGQDGNDGKSIVWKGESENPPTNPQVNWVYKDISDGIVYIRNEYGWEPMVVDGNDGTDGADGTDGLSVFITYNKSLEKPNKPTGNGTTNGWSTVASSDAIWMSQKVAESATAGTWGEPVKIKGQDGNDAYTIILSNENHTFVGDSAGKIITDQQTTCAITAYKGTTPQQVVIKEISGTGNGISASISNYNSSIIINAAAGDTPPASGTLTISLEIDGKTFTKTFSYSIAKQGADGALFQNPEENLLVATDPSYVEGSNEEILQKMAPYLFESHASSYVQIADDTSYKKCFQINSGARAGLGETYLCTSIATVNPNTQYTLSFYARGDASTLDIFSFYSDNLNHVFSNTFSGENNFSKGGIGLSTGWNIITYTFKTPSDCKKLFFRIDNNHGQTGYSKKLYLTKLKLQASNTATPYSISPYDPFFQDAARGPQGVQGPKGENGITTYTWIKYADDANGTGISNDPDGKEYIGFAYNKITETESDQPSDYTWSHIKGADGVPGEKGKDGKTYYTWIKYADTNTGTQMYDTPKETTKYIGIAVNKTTAEESDTKSDYTWSLFKGADGAPGAPGDSAIQAILSNEYHAIPCYSNGTVMGTNPYDGASTTMYVYEGSVDKSSNWSYSAVKTNITGSLSSNVFTVTEIKADIGYVDITATKNGQSLTKRFTIEKNKSGTSGYYLEVGHNVIKKEGNNYTPSSISTACRTISGETAITIASTLVIEYSTDGSTFTEYSRSNYSGSDSISVSGIVNKIGTSGSLAVVRVRMYKNESELLIDQVTIPVVSDGLQGATGLPGASITSVTTQYATVTKGANAPVESSSLWKDTSPTDYSSSNDYYYRYKQIYSNGDIKYTSPSNWFNPYSVKNGAVLEFDSDGYVVRELLRGLTWSYIDPQNTMTMPSSPDHTRGEDKQYVIVQFDGSDKTYVLSYDNLAVHTNILAEGTIISSNGLIGGWTINAAGLSKDAISVAPGGAIGIARAYMGPGMCFPSSSDGITGEGREWNELMTNQANLAFWDLDHLGGDNWKYILNFAVDTKGQLYARNANITGNITATSGTIGSNATANNRWQIGNQAIYNGTTSLTSTANGTYIGVDGIKNYNSGNGTTITKGELLNYTSDVYVKLIGGGMFVGNLNNTVQTPYAAFGLSKIESTPYGAIFVKYGTEFVITASSDDFTTGLPRAYSYLWCKMFTVEGEELPGIYSPTMGSFYAIFDALNVSYFENSPAFNQGATFKVGIIIGEEDDDGGGNGFIELYGDSTTKTPYIDFHYAKDPKDFTSRIIEKDAGSLSINSAWKNTSGNLELKSGSNISYKHHEYILTGALRSDSEKNYRNCLILSSASESAVIIKNGKELSNSNSAWKDCCFRTSTDKVGGRLYGEWQLNGTTMSATSDRNLKNSINTLSDKYSKLFDNLIPVQYKLNDGTSDRYHTGFIAQDVEEAILKVGLTTQDFAGFVRDNEETVVTEDGTVKQQLALRYEEFIALNTNEIQKLKKRVAELEEQVTQLLNQQN